MFCWTTLLTVALSVDFKVCDCVTAADSKSQDYITAKKRELVPAPASSEPFEPRTFIILK